MRVTRERSKTKKKLLRSARRPDGILRELFYSGLFYSVLFNSCNKAEEPIFGRLRNLWESFAFRVVCDPNTRSLVKFYPKWEPYQICLNLNKRENATFVRRDCVTVLICEVVNLWFVCRCLREWCYRSFCISWLFSGIVLIRLGIFSCFALTNLCCVFIDESAMFRNKSRWKLNFFRMTFQAFSILSVGAHERRRGKTSSS